MKILLITGSPHKNGTTEVLAAEFIRGAHQSGHDVIRFDAAHKMCTLASHARDAIVRFPHALSVMTLMSSKMKLSRRTQWFSCRRFTIME